LSLFKGNIVIQAQQYSKIPFYSHCCLIFLKVLKMRVCRT